MTPAAQYYEVSGVTGKHEGVTAAILAAIGQLMAEEGATDLTAWLDDKSERQNWLTLTCSGDDGVFSSTATISLAD
ncbi:MAG: hypothetical protein GY811_14755 [Myxococcales bacterium]|nr:hypothetical protein [Myxococcales bacterium]